MRAHIVALVASALIPAIAVGAIAVAAAIDSYGRAFDDRLEGTAKALATAVGAEIGSTVAVLSTLATARSLDGEADLAAFHERARRTAEVLGARIYVVAPDLSMVLHSDFPAGAALPMRPQKDSPGLVRRVFETGRPAIGNLVRGQWTGRAIAPLYVPVVREGKVAFALGSVVEAERLSRLLGEQEFRGGGYASLVDAAGRIVARSADHERYVGQRVRDWVMEGAGAGRSGLLRGANLRGAGITTAFHHVPGTPGWFVTVAEPDATYSASLRRPLATLALGGVAALAVALLVAWRIGKRIHGPVERLTREAEGVAASGEADEGQPEEGPEVRVREFGRLRAAVSRAHAALRERAAAVAAGEARLRAVVDTATDAIVVIDERGAVRSFNRSAEAIFGYRADEAIGRNVSMLMGADEAGRHDGNLAAYLRGGERKIIGVGREVEGRRKDGSAVPLDLSLAEWRDAGGRPFFTGIMRDISARKADEARRALLMRELDHRAKNILAVVQSVLRLSPRHDPRSFVAAVEARVAALARAHSLLAEGGWSGADLRAVAERELAAYADSGTGARRRGAAVSLDGPPVPLAASAVQPFAMVLHELATNAAKHGALSVPGGAVEVRWRTTGRKAGEDGSLRLRWTETGGPPVEGAPARRGFGSRVIEATVRGQLGGAVERRWEPSGLVVEVAVPLAHAVAGAAGRRNAAVPEAA